MILVKKVATDYAIICLWTCSTCFFVDLPLIWISLLRMMISTLLLEQFHYPFFPSKCCSAITFQSNVVWKEDDSDVIFFRSYWLFIFLRTVHYESKQNNSENKPYGMLHIHYSRLYIGFSRKKSHAETG